MIANSLGIKDTFGKGKVDFQDGELSLDNDGLKTFFLGFIFINDGSGLQMVLLVKAKDSVSEDFSNLAGALSGIS